MISIIAHCRFYFNSKLYRFSETISIKLQLYCAWNRKRKLQAATIAVHISWQGLYCQMINQIDNITRYKIGENEI